MSLSDAANVATIVLAIITIILLGWDLASRKDD